MTEGSRIVAILLGAIGVVALAVSMWMNFRFGFGLSQDAADQWTLAVLHLLIDPAAAALVVAGACLLRWGRRWESRWLLAFAVALVAYSILSTHGYLSRSRIGTTLSHDRQVEFDKQRLNWLQGSSVNSELAKGERRTLRVESDQLAKNIRTEVGIVTDAQAESLAGALGVPTEKVQRILITISAAIAQCIKFVSLLAAGLIWPRRRNGPGADSDRSHRGSSGGTVEVRLNRPTLVDPASVPRPAAGSKKVLRFAAPKQRLKPADALADLQRLTLAGSVPSQSVLCRRWNVPKATASRWLKVWANDHRTGIERFRAGKTNTIRRRIVDTGNAMAMG